jgi:hypothetical protein
VDGVYLQSVINPNRFKPSDWPGAKILKSRIAGGISRTHNIEQIGIEERDGIRIYDISFSSPVNGRSAAVGPNGGIVTAYLVVPSGQGRFPAVIFGHWCMPGLRRRIAALRKA